MDLTKARRKPCQNCGKPKDGGRGRRICTPCTRAGFVYCRGCETVKNRSDFFPAPSRSTGITTYCKRCAVDRNRDARYNMPRGTLQAMFAAQEGRCAMCSDLMTIDKANVDHDHRCCPGKAKSCGRCVRALLCRWCNHALGNLRDDPNRAVAAAAYILQHRGGDSDRSS